MLLVEDDRGFATVLARGLVAEGYVVDLAHDGRTGLRLARTGVYGVIVLDLMLPVMNGYEVCRALREHGDATPVLVLTAKSGEYDQLDALDGGADDFLTKPFSYAILLARLRALHRRAPLRVEEVLVVGDLSVDTRTRVCVRAGTEVPLGAREFDLLVLLARAGGDVVLKTELLLQLWPQETDDVNLVEARMSALRRKIDTAFGRASILTVRGSGYRLVDDAPRAAGR